MSPTVAFKIASRFCSLCRQLLSKSGLDSVHLLTQTCCVWEWKFLRVLFQATKIWCFVSLFNRACDSGTVFHRRCALVYGSYSARLNLDFADRSWNPQSANSGGTEELRGLLENQIFCGFLADSQLLPAADKTSVSHCKRTVVILQLRQTSSHVFSLWFWIWVLHNSHGSWWQRVWAADQCVSIWSLSALGKPLSFQLQPPVRNVGKMTLAYFTGLL